MKTITKNFLKIRKKFILKINKEYKIYSLPYFKFKIIIILRKFKKINSVYRHKIKRKIKNFIISNFKNINYVLFVIELLKFDFNNFKYESKIANFFQL